MLCSWEMQADRIWKLEQMLLIDMLIIELLRLLCIGTTFFSVKCQQTLPVYYNVSNRFPASSFFG